MYMYMQAILISVWDNYTSKWETQNFLDRKKNNPNNIHYISTFNKYEWPGIELLSKIHVVATKPPFSVQTVTTSDQWTAVKTL